MQGNVSKDKYLCFYVLRTVHFGMKLYNDQRKAQFLNLFTYLLLSYMFRAFLYLSLLGMVSAPGR
jgi:hypothetical protein